VNVLEEDINTVTHIHKIVPGPPKYIAKATPAKEPTPTLAPKDNDKASKVLTPSLLLSLLFKDLNIPLKFN